MGVMRWLTFLMAGVALLLSATSVAEAAWGLNVVGDILQQQDSAAAVGTTYIGQDGTSYLRIGTGYDPVGGNASVDMMNLLPLGADGSGRMGFNIRCERPVTEQACAELVLHNSPVGPNGGNLNWSAMADGTYRFGQEFHGTATAEDILWATEDSVTPGTEVYLKFDAARAGNSQPIALLNGHLRFDVPSRGGFVDTYWLGRGGAGVEFNAPYGGWVQFNSNGQAQFRAGGDAVGGKLGFYGNQAVYRPVVTGSRAGADDTTLSLLSALAALGLVTDGTTP